MRHVCGILRHLNYYRSGRHVNRPSGGMPWRIFNDQTAGICHNGNKDAANMDISPPTANNATFVEVERRFVISEKCYENLENCGAKLKKRLSFCDVYYDTPDHDLVLNDYWLRCRDEQWQLKCPPPKRSGSDAQTLQYAEYDGILDVFRHTKSVLVPYEAQTEHVPTERARDRPVVDGTVSRCSNENGSIVDVTSNSQFVDYLALCKCQPIARFRTERTKYTMGDDVTIDIDTADFGYSIGEIETLVAIGTSTERGVEKIKNVAHDLGVYSDQYIPGKLMVYLEKYQPSLYHQIYKKFGL